MTSEQFKDEIKQYNDIVRGIRDLKRRIKKLEEQSKIVQDSVRGSSKAFPFIEHTCIVEGIEQNERLKRRKKLLKNKQKELEKLKDEIELYINTKIDNERIRQILEYRYIDEFSWVKIANKLNGTEDGIRMEYKRFLKNL